MMYDVFTSLEVFKARLDGGLEQPGIELPSGRCPCTWEGVQTR